MFWGPLPSCFKSHQPAVIPREQLCEIPSPQIADAPGLPIDNDDPQSTKDIGCSLTASYSWRATRFQAVLSLQPLGVISGNLFSILDAFYHQTFASVKIQAMEILRTPKSRFELINLAVETREILRLPQSYYWICDPVCRVCPRKFGESRNSEMPAQLCVDTIDCCKWW